MIRPHQRRHILASLRDAEVNLLDFYEPPDDEKTVNMDWESAFEDGWIEAWQIPPAVLAKLRPGRTVHLRKKYRVKRDPELKAVAQLMVEKI